MSQSTPSPHPSSPRFGSSEYADLIGARLTDFFRATSPWQRRLWDVGTCLSLSEVVEASQWRGRGVLSEGSVSWLAQDVSRIAGRDPGVGEQAVKKHLNDVLKTHLGDGTRNLRRLEELAAMAADGYLIRWRRALESGARPSVERLSRAVAAHLLDRGFSLPHLRRWSEGHVSAKSTVNDLLLDAEDISNQTATDYEVVVPFRAVPGAKNPPDQYGE